MADIITPYQKDSAPKIVARWQRHAEDAPSLEEARLQLAFDALLELRAIKLLLAWVLIGVPVIAIIVTVVLAGALESKPGY